MFEDIKKTPMLFNISVFALIFEKSKPAPIVSNASGVVMLATLVSDFSSITGNLNLIAESTRPAAMESIIGFLSIFITAFFILAY